MVMMSQRPFSFSDKRDTKRFYLILYLSLFKKVLWIEGSLLKISIAKRTPFEVTALIHLDTASVYSYRSVTGERSLRVAISGVFVYCLTDTFSFRLKSTVCPRKEWSTNEVLLMRLTLVLNKDTIKISDVYKTIIYKWS